MMGPQTEQFLAWAIGCASALVIGMLAYWGVCGAFRRACAGLTPELVESLQLAQVMQGTPLLLRRQVFFWKVRVPLRLFLSLWPLFVMVVIGMICAAMLFIPPFRGTTLGLLPHFFSIVVDLEPFKEPQAQLGIMGTMVYLIIRIPSSIAGASESSGLAQQQSRLAGFIAAYRWLRAAFIHELMFDGDRERVLTDLAEDICDHWFPPNSRYQDERAKAFEWLATSAGLDKAVTNPHSALFRAIELRGVPYVVSELRQRIGDARREIRRKKDFEIAIAEFPGESLRADEFGCTRWHFVSSMRLASPKVGLQTGQTLRIVRIGRKRLRRAIGVQVRRWNAETVLALAEPSRVIGDILGASLA